MANGTVINAGSGTIDLNADESITLGSVVTTSASATAVTIDTAEGAVVDGGDAHVDIVADSGTVVINAVTGVGNGDALDTTIGTLDVDNLTSGNIQFAETNGVTVLRAQQAAAGNIQIEAGGTITAVSVVTLGGDDTNDITLTTTAAGNIEVGTITATPAGDVILTSAGAITATDGNSMITADDLSFTAAGAVGASDEKINTTVAEVLAGSSTGVGGIWLNEADAVILTSLTNANGLINVTADGKITAVSVITTGIADTDDITLTTTAGDIEVGTITATTAGRRNPDSRRQRSRTRTRIA